MKNPPPGYFENKRPEMLPFLPARRRRALEIGCGQGNFIASIDGVEERWGIEPVAVAATAAAARLDRVLAISVEDAFPELPEGYFDLVIANDVIEHLRDHEWFLAATRRYLAPGGVLVGSLPNVRYFHNLCELLLERDWCYRNDGILDRTHLHFFTEKSIRRSLRDAGYTIEAMKPINRFGMMQGGARGRFYKALAVAAIAGTAGYCRDIAYLQFGFRARSVP
jgi:SAM-dependent methyltransferase